MVSHDTDDFLRLHNSTKNTFIDLRLCSPKVFGTYHTLHLLLKLFPFFNKGDGFAIEHVGISIYDGGWRVAGKFWQS